LLALHIGHEDIWIIKCHYKYRRPDLLDTQSNTMKKILTSVIEIYSNSNVPQGSRGYTFHYAQSDGILLLDFLHQDVYTIFKN
jgi:hypothetical protein